ncbi:MAG: BCSC C-terminal domain-containing protein [Acidobacteria bacterium]|nr:BCSC C-terminal domain-containing protein [Acidobacteriota bacterium]MCI0720779.1 BCSC C-terminal domain-containing protein [Acidobacteriota bacterium]
MKRIFVSTVFVILLAGGLLPASDKTEASPGIHRPVSSQEIEELKRQISDETQSNIEFLADFHTESGDLNNRLDFWRFGARLNYKKSSGTLFYFGGVHTPYRTRDSVVDAWGTNLTAGIKGKLSEQVSTQVEVSGTRFSTNTTTINALGSLHFKASERSGLYVTASRSNVEESMLSAVGLRPVSGPFAGKLVGRVMDNRVILGGQTGLVGNLDLFGEGGVGNREGSNVDSNFFKMASGGLGYNIFAAAEEDPLSLFRVSYSVNYFGFEEDRLGFGGASLLTRTGRSIPPALLGSDGISPLPGSTQAGIGGYFSPERYLSNVARIDLQGRPSQTVRYRLSGFAGGQNYTGSATRLVSGFSANLTFRLNDVFSLPVGYLVDNFGPFTQQSAFVRLAVMF